MININRAEVEELTEIDGIGRVTALSIIQYRKRQNGFTELKELKNVRGIADKTYKKIKLSLTISDEKSNIKRFRIEVKPEEIGIENPNEMHLVGEMNNWNPEDKSFSLIEKNDGTWTNRFNLEAGTEYKIMYDSISWEENKYIGDNGHNFKVSY